jgi:hypothetical protein
MTKARTYQYAKETVDKQRVKILFGDFLVIIKIFYQEIGQRQSYQPAQRVPADRKRADADGHFTRVPDDV